MKLDNILIITKPCRQIINYTVFLLCLICEALSVATALAEKPSGIGPLLFLSQSPHSLIDLDTRPLLTQAEIEQFLNDLEGTPPDWSHLRDRPGEEIGSRVFAFNRNRDAARLEQPSLLTQRIAFRWGGLLTRFSDEHNGFFVAIGPEFIRTQWGMVRFKPVGLPEEMVVITSQTQHRQFLERLEHGEHIEIGVLFIGRLAPDESIIYAFDHDDPEQGLVMPVVQVEAVKYFFTARVRQKE